MAAPTAEHIAQAETELRDTLDPDAVRDHEWRAAVEHRATEIMVASERRPSTPPPTRAARAAVEERPSPLVQRVVDLHGKRTAVSSDLQPPHSYDYCVECRQVWPCATLRVLGVTA